MEILMERSGAGKSSKISYLAAGVIQLLYAGMFVVSKVAFDGGMNNFIFVFYRQAVASCFLLPFALFFGWNRAPPLSFSTFCKMFMLSLVGITLSLNINGVGLICTSATLAAASANSLPVITFILAVLLGVESVNMRRTSGIAKVAGILICAAGVATLAFYKGPDFIVVSHPILRLSTLHATSSSSSSSSSSIANWIRGCFIMLLSNILWALWLVLQGRVLKSYPSKLLFTTLQCLMSAFQSFFIAIAVERHPQQWTLGWNVRLIAVAYCGIAVTGVCYYLQTFVIEKKGPVFLSLSTPFCLVITIICSTFLLGHAVSLGSILGGLLLIGGLYSVLWGKSAELLKTGKSDLEVEKEGALHFNLKEVVVVDANKGHSPVSVAAVST